MSEKYTYADVIIDPDDPRVEIGAEYYCSTSVGATLKYANKGDKNLLAKLDRVNKPLGNHFEPKPFSISYLRGTGGDTDFLIRKKEPEKTYVPFDLSDKKVRDELRGKWIIPKGHSGSIEKQITLFGSQMTEYGKIWCVDMDITPDKLLASWTFIDGTPCGILKGVTDD